MDDKTHFLNLYTGLKDRDVPDAGSGRIMTIIWPDSG